MSSWDTEQEGRQKRADPEIISKIRRLASAGNKPVKETEGEYQLDNNSCNSV